MTKEQPMTTMPNTKLAKKITNKILKILPVRNKTILSNISDRLTALENNVGGMISATHQMDRLLVEVQNQIQKFKDRKQGTTKTINNIAQLVGKTKS